MRRLTIYLMIFLLFIPQNSIILAESVHDKPESKEVVLLAEHTGEEIEAYSRDDLLLEGLSDYVIPDDTRVLLLTNDKKEDLKVDGKIYSLISYMKENQIVELFVPTDVIITLDLENEFKNKRLHNEKLEEINTNENSTEENDDSSENITDIIENEESDLNNTNDNEGVGSESDSDEINEEIKIDPVEETEDIDEKHEQDKRENNKNETISVQSNALTQETSTSKLGHIRSSNVEIYETIGGKSFKAGSKYTNAVYYIKRQAVVGSDTYYLLSKNPSATTGVVGWAKSTDLSTHDHKGVDKIAKVFTIKGTGKATSKAWGGKQDEVHSTLTSHKGSLFQVNLTEKVGKNTWYRGKINGKGSNVWIHSSYLTSRQKTIVIDAGHGGSDPGTSANGIVEKILVLDIAKRVEKLLKNAGYNVIMTRSDDEYVKLDDRTEIANKANADLFISIHGNAGGGEGIETFWYSEGPQSKESEALASEIQKELIKKTGAKDRGVKDGNLHVNRESKMPSSLIEVGFLDNKSDANKLKDDKYKQTIAEAIVNGIKKYFG